MSDDKYFNPISFLLIRDESLRLWNEVSQDMKEFEVRHKTDVTFPIGSQESILKIQFKIVTALHYSGMILNFYERLKSLLQSNQSFEMFISQHSRANDETIKILFAVDRVNNIQKHLLITDIDEKNDAFVGIAKMDKKFYWVHDNVDNVANITGKTKKQIDCYKLLLAKKEIVETIPQIEDAIFNVGIPRK